MKLSWCIPESWVDTREPNPHPGWLLASGTLVASVWGVMWTRRCHSFKKQSNRKPPPPQKHTAKHMWRSSSCAQARQFYRSHLQCAACGCISPRIPLCFAGCFKAAVKKLNFCCLKCREAMPSAEWPLLLVLDGVEMMMIAHRLIRAGPNWLNPAGLLQDKFAPGSLWCCAVIANMRGNWNKRSTVAANVLACACLIEAECASG